MHVSVGTPSVDFIVHGSLYRASCKYYIPQSSLVLGLIYPSKVEYNVQPVDGLCYSSGKNTVLVFPSPRRPYMPPYCLIP